MIHEHTVIDPSPADPIGGPRCLHDFIAAWCSWCRGLDESEVIIDGEPSQANRNRR